jgi:hypothetical protein
MAIDKAVTDRNAIATAIPGATARDFRDALITYDHLDPIKVYDMGRGPREFESWKEAWRDQVVKAATGHHPAQIKHRCFLEMKKSLSVNTMHWVQSFPALDGQREDPDAILRELQKHAQSNANVATLLLNAAKANYGEHSNHVEVYAHAGSIVRYFDKAADGDHLGGIYKWILLMGYGNNEKLRLRLVNKWDKVDHHEFFRLITEFYETNKKSSQLYNSSETYTLAGNQGKKKKGWPGKEGAARTDAQPTRGFQTDSQTCFHCGGSRHAPKQCPAFGKNCERCRKPNHFAKVCQAPAPFINQAEATAQGPQVNMVEITPAQQRQAIRNPMFVYGGGVDTNGFELSTAPSDMAQGGAHLPRR